MAALPHKRPTEPLVMGMPILAQEVTNDQI